MPLATRSGMGVDAADYDHDGRIDLFLTTVDHNDNASFFLLASVSAYCWLPPPRAPADLMLAAHGAAASWWSTVGPIWP